MVSIYISELQPLPQASCSVAFSSGSWSASSVAPDPGSPAPHLDCTFVVAVVSCNAAAAASAVAFVRDRAAATDS